MDKKIIVTGGAGYLGRIAAEFLKETGYTPVILDNFSRSQRTACKGLETYEVDLSDLEATQEIIGKIEKPLAVFHFAAFALVHESTENPHLYFRNNVLSTVNIAECCRLFRIENFIHSSSCAVYGQPEKIPLNEETPFNPVSPYGETKKIAEGILNQYAKVTGLKIIHLRYFNPVGSYKKLGENHIPETHFVPNLIRAVLEKVPITLNGNDYPTEDGTCVRDFIHVEDLIRAHLLSLEFLLKQAQGYVTAFNLGSGKGYSLKEVIKETEKIVNRSIPIVFKPRRWGDPPQLYANNEKINKALGWSPQKGIKEMIRSELDFRKENNGKH